VATVLLVFAAVAAPCGGLSQTPDASVSSDRQRQLIARIEEEQTLHGINAEQLIEPLSDLALFYLEHGDRALAKAAAERANGVVRMNLGLKTLEQAPLVRVRDQIAEAEGDAERAWQLDLELFQLVEDHPGDLGTVPILHDLAVKRSALLDRYRAGEIPPEIALGCYYLGGPLAPGIGAQAGPGGAGPSCHSGSRGRVLGALASEVNAYRFMAVRALLGSELYASGRLDELTALAVDNCRRYHSDPRAACAEEIDLIGRLAYDVGSSIPAVDALVRTADWRMVGGQWWRSRPQQAAGLPFIDCADCDAALDAYRQAYRALEQAGVEQDVIERVFAPRVPVLLPATVQNPYTEVGGAAGGHVDVAFEITKEGRAVNVKVRDATPEASRVEKLHLVQRIAGSRFRPMIVNGEVADAVPVVVRYDLRD
jgi:hypothetical protein